MRRLIRLLRYVSRYWLQVLAAVVLMAIVGLMESFRVLLIGPVLNQVLHPDSTSNAIPLFAGTNSLDLHRLVPHYHNVLTVVSLALVFSTVIKGIADYLGTYLINYAGFGTITDMRDDLYNAILRRSVAFFQRHTTGTILSTLINDVERVQFALSGILAESLQQVFTFIFTAAVVIMVGGRLAWVLLLFIPVVIFSARRIGRSVRHTTRKGQDKLADIQNILHETITGNRIVKAFVMERWEISRFRAAARKLFRANLRSVRAQAVSSPLMDIVGAIGVAVLLKLGCISIQTGAMSVGSFFVFIVAVFKLYDPVRKFALYYNNFQQALGASSAIFEFMDAQDDVAEKSGALKLPGFSRNICFEHVDFAYRDEQGEHPVLHDIDLEVRAGEVVALVGPSGAGKSTLVRLLPRFFDATKGRILLDGHDLRDVTLDSLRGLIGKVTQETILFNDTVRNNIAYGRPDVPFAQVEVAAQNALAHDFILRMPEGYDTIIGEKGFRLSGGERQRIAIARALLKDAPILILDEATSALDSESESLVQSALHNLMQNRTVFVIAHRLSTVRRADRIIVLENGAISDVGNHQDLINKLGTYQRLYNLQFVEVEPQENIRVP